MTSASSFSPLTSSDRLAEDHSVASIAEGRPRSGRRAALAPLSSSFRVSFSFVTLVATFLVAHCIISTTSHDLISFILFATTTPRHRESIISSSISAFPSSESMSEKCGDALVADRSRSCITTRDLSFSSSLFSFSSSTNSLSPDSPLSSHFSSSALSSPSSSSSSSLWPTTHSANFLNNVISFAEATAIHSSSTSSLADGGDDDALFLRSLSTDHNLQPKSSSSASVGDTRENRRLLSKILGAIRREDAKDQASKKHQQQHQQKEQKESVAMTAASEKEQRRRRRHTNAGSGEASPPPSDAASGGTAGLRLGSRSEFFQNFRRDERLRKEYAQQGLGADGGGSDGVKASAHRPQSSSHLYAERAAAYSDQHGDYHSNTDYSSKANNNINHKTNNNNNHNKMDNLEDRTSSLLSSSSAGSSSSSSSSTQWYQSPVPLTQARSKSAITFYDSKIIIAGGCTNVNCTTKSALLESIDPSQDNTPYVSVIGDIPVKFAIKNIVNQSAPPTIVQATVAGPYSVVTVETITANLTATSSLWLVGPCATYIMKEDMTYEDIAVMNALHGGLWGLSQNLSSVETTFALPSNVSLRANASCIAYLNRIFIVGGINLNEIDAEGNFVMLDTIDAYDIRNGSYYSSILTLKSERMNAAIAVDNTMLYVAGGQSRSTWFDNATKSNVSYTVISTDTEAFVFSLLYLFDESAEFGRVDLPQNDVMLRAVEANSRNQKTTHKKKETAMMLQNGGVGGGGGAATGELSKPYDDNNINTNVNGDDAEGDGDGEGLHMLSASAALANTGAPPPASDQLWATPRIFSFGGYITMTLGTSVTSTLQCFGGNNVSLPDVPCLTMVTPSGAGSTPYSVPATWELGNFLGMEGQTGATLFAFPSSTVSAWFGTVLSFYAVGGILEGSVMSAGVYYAFTSIHASNPIELQQTYTTGVITLAFGKIASGWLRLSPNIDCYGSTVVDMYLNMSTAVDGRLNVSFLAISTAPSVYLCFAFGSTNVPTLNLSSVLQQQQPEGNLSSALSLPPSSDGRMRDSNGNSSSIPFLGNGTILGYQTLYGCLTPLAPFAIVSPTTPAPTTVTALPTTTSVVPPFPNTTTPTDAPDDDDGGGFPAWIKNSTHAIEFALMLLAVIAVIVLSVFLFFYIRKKNNLRLSGNSKALSEAGTNSRAGKKSRHGNNKSTHKGGAASRAGGHPNGSGNTDDMSMNHAGGDDLLEHGLATDGGKFIFDNSDSIVRNTTLDSRYRIVRRIGQGSFSSVYLVQRRGEEKKTTFAMKYLICENDRDRLEAIKECETINSIQGHPNIIALFDMFMNYEFGVNATPYTSTLQPRPSALNRLNKNETNTNNNNSNANFAAAAAGSPTAKTSLLLGANNGNANVNANASGTPPAVPLRDGGGGGAYGATTATNNNGAAAATATAAAPATPASPATTTLTTNNGQQRSIHTRYLCLIMEYHPSGDLCHFLLKTAKPRREDYHARVREYEAYWKASGRRPHHNNTHNNNHSNHQQQQHHLGGFSSPNSSVSMTSINRNSARISTNSVGGGGVDAPFSPPSVPYYQPLNESALLSVAMQLCAALNHLHSCRPAPIVHRDLKPENILIRGPLPSPDETFIPILITDFGLAFLQEENRRSGRGGGTRPYISPESWKGQTTTASDMWSLGCVLYALATERMIAENVRIMFEDAKHPRFKEDILRDLCEVHGYSLELGQLILALLEVDPRRRPTGAQLLRRFEEIEISDEHLDELLFPLHNGSLAQNNVDSLRTADGGGCSESLSRSHSGVLYSPSEGNSKNSKTSGGKDGKDAAAAASVSIKATPDQQLRAQLTPEDVAQRHKTVRIRPFVVQQQQPPPQHAAPQPHQQQQQMQMQMQQHHQQQQGYPSPQQQQQQQQQQMTPQQQQQMLQQQQMRQQQQQQQPQPFPPPQQQQMPTPSPQSNGGGAHPIEVQQQQQQPGGGEVGPQPTVTPAPHAAVVAEASPSAASGGNVTVTVAAAE